MKVVLFYHCLFVIGNDALESAGSIVGEQTTELRKCGLLEAASEMHVGVNGGDESKAVAEAVLPSQAKVTYHGLQCRNELRTLLLLEKWLAQSDEEAYVLYFHAKGATHRINTREWNRRLLWRECMMRHLVSNWRQCVQDLHNVESVGCHWMQPPATPAGQYIWAGNFWWARASFLRTLPSLMERDRIKVSGVDALESRYESEVWIGNGLRRPTIRDYCPGWDPMSKRHVEKLWTAEPDCRTVNA